MKMEQVATPKNTCCDCETCNMPCARNTALKHGAPLPPKLLSDDIHNYNNIVFQEIYDMHYKRVFAIAYRMTRNKEDAEDIMQETFMRAYANYTKLDPRAPVFALLCKITTNLFIDSVRKHKHIQLISLDGCFVSDILEQHCAQLMKMINIGENLEMEETVVLVNKAMDTMPPHYCQVIVLRGCEGLPSKEVAKMMGISVSAVDTLLHRARKQFKRIYKELCIGQLSSH